MTADQVVRAREIRTLEDIYNQLPVRQREWINSVNPLPVHTLSKSEIFIYVSENGLPVTTYAIKRAIENGELPSKMVGRTRRVAPFDALVWAVSRADKRVSA